MSTFDLMFYGLALLATCAALVGALAGDLRRASTGLLVVRAAMAALSVLLGLIAVAAAQVAVALATIALERRSRRGGSEDVLTADAPPRRWRAALPVLALFVLASRAVLMARWPILAAAPPAPVVVVALPLATVGFPHCIVTALLVWSIGLFACTARRTADGIGIGVAIMGTAAVLAVVAISRFVSGAEEGRLLAVLVVGLSALPPWLAVLLRRAASPPASSSLHPEHDPGSTGARLAGTLSAVVAAIAVALLAVAW